MGRLRNRSLPARRPEAAEGWKMLAAKAPMEGTKPASESRLVPPRRLRGEGRGWDYLFSSGLRIFIARIGTSFTV